VPGRYTTASLLLTLFGPRDVTLVEAPFARVMPLVAAGECDAGLVIHEGRFTYEGHGLLAIADLGELWQQATGLPLPLGVIAIQRHLGPDLYAGVGALLRASVALAQRDPAATRAFVREHSQELADDVCARHIALYVNAFTLDLGDTGRAAIDELLRRGRAAGHLPAGTSPWWEGR
jgi:1,4-dihydroxy-6-naphthoate synthase